MITFRMLIDGAGEMQSAESESSADATLVLTQSMLFRFFSGDASVFEHITTVGDSALAGELLDIGRQIDVSVVFENDLSKVVGDIPAHRIAQSGKDFVHWQIDNVDRLTRSLKEYLTEENVTLTKFTAIQQMAEEAANLQVETELLEQRINRLIQQVSPLSDNTEKQ